MGLVFSPFSIFQMDLLTNFVGVLGYKTLFGLPLSLRNMQQHLLLGSLMHGDV